MLLRLRCYEIKLIKLIRDAWLIKRLMNHLLSTFRKKTFIAIHYVEILAIGLEKELT